MYWYLWSSSVRRLHKETINLMYLSCVYEPGTMDPRCQPSSGWSAASSQTRWTLASVSTGWRIRVRKQAGWSTCTLYVPTVGYPGYFLSRRRSDIRHDAYLLLCISRQRSWMKTRGWSVLWTTISFRRMEAGLRWGKKIRCLWDMKQQN